jgi:phosphonate transport system substrate-binding protein
VTTRPDSDGTFALSVFVLTCLPLLVSISAAPPDDEGLTIAFTKGLFADVSATDATAATKIWAAELKKKRGFSGPADAVAFEDYESLLKSWDRKEIDLLVLMSSEFLRMNERAPLVPQFVPVRAETAKEESLLIVRRDSGITTIHDLSDKDILILSDARGNLGKMWLEKRVIEEARATVGTFFRSSRKTTKSSQTVLPVFFGQMDACLVPSTSFDILCELNPQLRRELLVLESSPAMVSSVLCIRPDYRSDLKEGLVEALLQLHKEPRGQQILMMFKVDRLVPLRESDLDSARDLVNEYKHRFSLMKKVAAAR